MSTSPSNPAASNAATGSFEGRALSASLTVKDLARSVAWYRDAVGFTVEREYERDGKVQGAVLRAGPVRILLNQDDGAKGLDRVKGEGFSLQISTTQDVDAIANRIKAAGSTLDTEPADMPWGARAFRLRDPDGYKLAISREK